MGETSRPALHLCVGLDWASAKHDLTVYTAQGTLVTRF